jgi:cytochrome d ubiquinol oxidase subunit II
METLVAARLQMTFSLAFHIIFAAVGIGLPLLMVMFFRQLVSPGSLPVLAAGLACFAASAWAVFGRRYRLSRVFAAGEIVLLLLGWGLAHRPYLVYPDITLQRAAAPAPKIAFMLATLPFGALLLIPSLWLLFHAFKAARTPE